ncbi:cytochrome P450 9e2-like isoform X2 [Arctopsyche grandis]|uniref:cytochrome P450 9e2-like isoform X2 n=1 Tax=Arctopsyche grandis TaxID=121162 RepID=UPI00406D9794
MGLTYTELFVYFIGILIAIYLYGIKNYGYFKNKGVKYIEAYFPFIGSTSTYMLQGQHISDFLLSCYNKYQDEKYIGMFLFQRPAIFLRDPEIMKLVGIKNFDSFGDHPFPMTDEMDPLFGNALLTLKDQKWRDMRSTLSPGFSKSKMKELFILIEETAKDYSRHFVERASKIDKNIIEIETKDMISRYTNDIVASSVFGLKTDSLINKENEFYRLGKLASDFSGLRLFKYAIASAFPKLFKIFNLTFLPKEAISFFRNLVESSIKIREKSGIIRNDMIKILIETKNGSLKHDKNSTDSFETGFATVQESEIGKRNVSRKWTDDELTAQAMLFFIAGFDSTSNLIIYIIYELACNPDIQKKLQNEIDDYIKISGEDISYDKLSSLNYLDMTISETLRKWPPFVVIDRECTKNYLLPPPNATSTQSYQVKKGDPIWFPIYSVHHDPKNYPNPERFQPERFSEENKSSIKPGTFMPFGIGPRNCIGSRFALMVAKAIIFHLLAKFDITVTKNTRIPIKLDWKTINFVPDGGMYVGLKLRDF